LGTDVATWQGRPLQAKRLAMQIVSCVSVDETTSSEVTRLGYDFLFPRWLVLTDLLIMLPIA